VLRIDESRTEKKERRTREKDAHTTHTHMSKKNKNRLLSEIGVLREISQRHVSQPHHQPSVRGGEATQISVHDLPGGVLHIGVLDRGDLLPVVVLLGQLHNVGTTFAIDWVSEAGMIDLEIVRVLHGLVVELIQVRDVDREPRD
jgi:hypothetical protein